MTDGTYTRPDTEHEALHERIDPVDAFDEVEMKLNRLEWACSVIAHRISRELGDSIDEEFGEFGDG